jgi:hypothetical protein
MKARITCDSNHPLGKLFESLFDVEYCSRSTGFDTRDYDLSKFLNCTHKYDYTINFTRGMRFGQSNLLVQLDEYCSDNSLPHKVFNIGSYVSIVLLNNPRSSYEIEKGALKLAHRKVAYEHMFHNGMLDSYLINLGHLETISVDVENHYQHLNTLKLDEVIKNVRFMLERPYVKELSVQYNQPGNHRVNDGIGLVLPGLF